MARPRSDIGPRIIHAARARFLIDGVNGASLRQIAEEANTNIGMVYYYFATKDDLFLAVVEEVYVALLADLEAALAPALPVLARVRRLYQRLGALSSDEQQVLRIVIREILASPVRLGRLIERFRRGHLPLVLQLVHDGCADGTFDPRIPPALIMLNMMMLGGPMQAAASALRGRLPLPVPALGPSLTAALVALLLEGVGGPATESPHRAPAVRGRSAVRRLAPVSRPGGRRKSKS